MSEVTSDSLMIAGARRRGRPPVAEKRKPVTALVPPAYLDRLDRLALKHGVSVSRVVCRLIQQSLDRTNKKID